MTEQPTAQDLVAHALKIRTAQDKLRQAMAQVSAEVAAQPAPAPAPKPAQ